LHIPKCGALASAYVKLKTAQRKPLFRNFDHNLAIDRAREST